MLSPPPQNEVILPQLESLAQSFVEPIARYTAVAQPEESAATEARKTASSSSNPAREVDAQENVSLGFAESTFLTITVDTRFSQAAGR